jgi:hypothetical protein
VKHVWLGLLPRPRLLMSETWTNPWISIEDPSNLAWLLSALISAALFLLELIYWTCIHFANTSHERTAKLAPSTDQNAGARAPHLKIANPNYDVYLKWLLVGIYYTSL